VALAAACGPIGPPPAAPAPLTASQTAGSQAAARGDRGAAPPGEVSPGVCMLEGLPEPLYSPRDPAWGQASAPVVIVLFSDFQCPFCAMARTTLDQLKSRYPDKIRIVWKNKPLGNHKRARPAAEAAQGVFQLAGPEAFWRFHDLLFTHRKELDDESLLRWAHEAGLPATEALAAGLQAHTFSAKVNEDLSLSDRIGVGGTPFFLVNGLPVEGAKPAEAFDEFLLEEIKNGDGTPSNACKRMQESWAPSR
jgi:predicted DsbA family dithiol-disulfide isomerase